MPPDTAPTITRRQRIILKGSRLKLRGKMFAMSGGAEGAKSHEKWRRWHRCGHQRAADIESSGGSMQAMFVKFFTSALFERSNASIHTQSARKGPLPLPIHLTDFKSKSAARGVNREEPKTRRRTGLPTFNIQHPTPNTPRPKNDHRFP